VSTPTHSARPRQSGTTTVNPDQLEVAPGREKEAVEGWIPNLASEDELRQALEKAFDYRGDVTITRKDGKTLDGYIFDRVGGKTLETSFVRLLPKDSNQRIKLAYSEIAALAFSGRDPAAGKSWEAWVKKYWDKRQSGEGNLNIEPESLEE